MVVLAEPYRVDGDPVSGHAETVGDWYECHRCAMYFHRDALNSRMQPISPRVCPHCMQPWSKLPARPAPPAVTHTGK